MTIQKIKKHNDPISLPKQNPRDYSRFFLPFILIISAIVFSNTLDNNFIDNLDDNGYILNNEIIKHLNWENIKNIFSTFCLGNYHPLTLLSYSIEYKLFGLNPFPFHLTNYILHLLNTLLVYLFMKRFTGKLWVAAITSLFFAIHPMHVESVAWISERKDVLYTFFFLLALNCYSKYLVTEQKISYVTWTFFWFFLSLMSKPAAVCLPLVLVLMDFYHRKKIFYRAFTSKIPFFALALLFGIVAIVAQKSAAYIADLTPLFSIFDRIFLVSYSTVYYLIKVFAPFNLSALHFYPVKSDGALPIEYYFAALVLLLLIWGVFKSGRFKYELIFGLLFYFTTIALVLQILPVGGAIVSERYSYIPYIGVFFIFGQFFSVIEKKSFNNTIKSVVSFILIIFTVLYSFLTYERNKVWKDGIILYTDVIEKYPQQHTPFNTRGVSFKNLNRMNEALSDFNKAIELTPRYADAYLNRGNVYAKIGKYKNAVSDYSKGLELNPQNRMAYYYGRGISKANLKDFAGAIANYDKALELQPGNSIVYYYRGISFKEINQINEALNDFNKAIELNPKDVESYFYRGNIYAKIGNYENAISDFTKGLKLTPDPIAYYYRGFSKAELKDFTGAIADYDKALDMKPKSPDIYFNRAMAKFNLNDKKNACNDLLSAQQYGNTKAAAALERYCK